MRLNIHIQKRIFEELKALLKLDQLNPQNNQESCDQFLAIFDWTDSTLEKKALQAIEDLLVEFHHICARHRFDSGLNIDFKVIWTLIDKSPTYSQCLPTAINLKKDITVYIALLHLHGITTTLPLSKYASLFLG